MIRSSVVVLALLLLPTLLAAQEPDPPADRGLVAGETGERVHTVEAGQTLAELARIHYGSAEHWRIIYEANRDVLDDPDRVRPGQELRVPAREGMDRTAPVSGIEVWRGGEVSRSPTAGDGVADREVDGGTGPEAAAGAGERGAPGPEARAEGALAVATVLEPGRDGGQVPDTTDPAAADRAAERRALARSRDFQVSAPPTFPADQERTVFYARTERVRTEPEVVGWVEDTWPEVPTGVHAVAGWIEPGDDHPDRLGTILSFAGDQDMRLRRSHTMTYDDLRVDLEGSNRVEPGDLLLAYRTRPVGERGVVIMPTGKLEVRRVEETGVVARARGEYQALLVGDAVAPYRGFSTEPGVHPVEADPDEAILGTILAFERQRQVPQVHDRVFIDLGARDGLRPGDVFIALTGGEDGWAGRPVARLQVVRVQETTATLRVVLAHGPSLAEGLTVQRILRMP